MFLGVIMACGFINSGPTTVDTCEIATSGRAFRTEEECFESVRKALDNIYPNLPEGVYISDATCFQVDSNT